MSMRDAWEDSFSSLLSSLLSNLDFLAADNCHTPYSGGGMCSAWKGRTRNPGAGQTTCTGTSL